MAFGNPTFRKEKASDGTDLFVLVYSDGTTEYVDRFSIHGSFTQADMQKRVRDTLASLNQSKASVTTLTEGTVIPASPDPSPIPTQADLDQAVFIKEYQQWLAIKRGIDAGIIDPTNAIVIAFQNKVKADFKLAYLPLL